MGFVALVHASVILIYHVQVRFYVIEKTTGKVMDTHFTSPACFVFHHINAYEEDGMSQNITSVYNSILTET